MRVVLDTNVVLDALACRKPWNTAAEQIFLYAANQQIQLYITASQSTDIYYLIHKYSHDQADAKDRMNRLFAILSVLDVTGTDCIDALQSKISDYEDAVLEQSSYHSQIDYIVTRNSRDFLNSRVTAITPDELVSICKAEY